jgi:predicted RNA-binding Zn ribbon-like protein
MVIAHRIAAVAGMPKLVGGELCLDFVNTVDPRLARERYEYLGDYGALVAWAEHAGAIDPATSNRLRRAGARRPTRARMVLRRALRLREAIYRVLAATIEKRTAPRDAVDGINDELRLALRHSRILPGSARFSLSWQADPPALEQPLWPVVKSAADLLTKGPLDRVRQCPGPGNCGWLFLDLSKNATRRWCDMRTCGNRVKAHRHYQRRRAHRAS